METSAFFDKDPIKRRLLPQLNGLKVSNKNILQQKLSLARQECKTLDKVAMPEKLNLNATKGEVKLKENSLYGKSSLLFNLQNEYCMVSENITPGVFILPSEHRQTLWNGIIFLRNGLYCGATYRFKIDISDNYLSGITPRVIFSKPGIPFHPQVDAVTGELDLSEKFPVWRCNKDKLYKLVKYIRSIFYVFEFVSPRNMEASECFENNVPLLRKNIAESIKISNKNIFTNGDTNDNKSIRLKQLDGASYNKTLIDLTERLEDFSIKKCMKSRSFMEQNRFTSDYDSVLNTSSILNSSSFVTMD